MSYQTYFFLELSATNAAGMAVHIAAGSYRVEVRSLVYRVRIGGREVDLTRAEFDRLQRAGKVVEADD